MSCLIVKFYIEHVRKWAQHRFRFFCYYTSLATREHAVQSLSFTCCTATVRLNASVSWPVSAAAARKTQWTNVEWKERVPPAWARRTQHRYLMTLTRSCGRRSQEQCWHWQFYWRVFWWYLCVYTWERESKGRKDNWATLPSRDYRYTLRRLRLEVSQLRLNKPEAFFQVRYIPHTPAPVTPPAAS